MLSLTIHHNIHLSKTQRYALHDGESVETVGVSVPVWFMKNMTSEPAKEVFCRYCVKNPRKDVPIQILEDGYEIHLPHRDGVQLKITDEEWRELNFKKPDKLDALYRQTVQEVSSKNLLDVCDGGSGYLMYREHNKIKRDNQMLNIMHFVTIGTLESLTEELDLQQEYLSLKNLG